MTNNLVRQALRYLTPREQIIESVYAGHARIGNDLFDYADPDYDHSLPQRPYDPEKAKSLLKRAGVTSLSDSTFALSEILAGVSDMCELFASACAQAGFPLRTKVVPVSDYFSVAWPDRYPISVTWFRERAISDMWRISALPTASLNDTNFINAAFVQNFNELLKTSDPSLQRELLYNGQKILYDEGGYIIPAYPNFLQATSTKVINVATGIVDYYANWNFRKTSFKS